MDTYTFKSRNEDVATVSGKTVTGVALGTAYIDVFDKNDVMRGSIKCKVVQKPSQESGDEPTGITVSPKSVQLTYLGDNTKFLNATVTPNTATNKQVLWESSDSSVAWVSSSGKVIAENKSGIATITAYTYNKLSDTCKVSVTAQGTFIKAVSPPSVSAIPAKGAVKDFTVTKDIMGGEDSGFAVYGESTGFTTYEGGKSSTEVNSFTQAFPVNWGNEQTIKMQTRGNFTDDEGVTIEIKQLACPVMKRLIVSSKSFPASDSVDMWYPLDFEAALGSVSGGKINVSTAKSIVTSANNNITDSKSSGGNPVDWVRLDTASVGVSYLPGDSGNKNLDEYKSKGTINGSVPQGKTAVYMCTLECDENTTGQSRKAYIHFPTYVYKSGEDTPNDPTDDHTYVDGYAVFTVTQSA